VFSYVLLCLLAFVYSNLLEWLVHKYIFHGIGKSKNNPFSSHWHTHHRMCRKNHNVDITYKDFPLHPTVKKEVASLIILCIIHLPLLFINWFFYMSLLFFSARYFYLHRKSHMNVEWGKKNLPWHHDHHMGKNQDANWGVTNPLWDYILGTRIKCPKKKSNSTLET